MVVLVFLGNFAAVPWVFDLCVVPTLPLATGAAILRYRLYDLDRIISRTLAYGLLTVLLGGGYAGVVLGLGQLLGRRSSLVVATATLAVAALFQPARRRVQAAVDRRFNRRRYDAAQDHPGVHRPPARAGRPRHPLGRVARRGRPDDGTGQRVAVAAAANRPSCPKTTWPGSCVTWSTSSTWTRSLSPTGRRVRPASQVGLGALVGVDLPDPGLVPQVQDLAAVVEMAGMLPAVVHGRMHQPDRRAMPSQLTGQIQPCPVVVGQMGQQPSNPMRQRGSGGHRAHRFGWPATAPTCSPVDPAGGASSRCATAVGTIAVSTTTLTSTENCAWSMIPAVSP
jgi:hypothetical protein